MASETLSDKIRTEAYYSPSEDVYLDGDEVINVEDVREFIKRVLFIVETSKTNTDKLIRIKELAGEELTKENEE